MKIYAFALLACIALVAAKKKCHSHKCAFHEHVNEVLSSDCARFTIDYEIMQYINSVQTATGSDPTDEQCADKLLVLLEQYEKGELTVRTTRSTQEEIEYLYGGKPLITFCEFDENTVYHDKVDQYMNNVGCGGDDDWVHFETWTDAPTTPAPEEATISAFNETRLRCYDAVWFSGRFKKLDKSDLDKQIHDGYFAFVSDSMTDAQKRNEIDQLNLYGPYQFYTNELYNFTTQYTANSFCPEQFYAILGEIMSEEVYRYYVSHTFESYDKKCPKAPKELKWKKMIKDTCKTKKTKSNEKRSGSGEKPKSGEKSTGREWIPASVDLVEALLFVKDKQVMDYIMIHMEDEVGEIGQGTCDTTTDSFELLIVTIAKSCGLVGWQEYESFLVEFKAIYVTIKGDWSQLQLWIFRFFEIVCDFTDTQTTALAEETTAALAEETTVAVEEVTDTTATVCPVFTPEEECSLIIKYFRFVGKLMFNNSWRRNFNGKIKKFKMENPSASRKQKSKHFKDASKKVMKQHSGEKELSSNEPDDDDMNHGWEFFMEFSIDVFLAGDYELLSECACDMHEMDDFVPTDAPGAAPTTSPDCAEIKSPKGIHWLIECIAIEAGIYEISWFKEWKIQFISIWESIDFKCGCWDSYSWNWELEWVSLILEFLESVRCGCASSVAPSTIGSWDYYRFYAYFCEDSVRVDKLDSYVCWYFEGKGWASWDDFDGQSEDEKLEFFTLCFNYMILCTQDSNTPAKVPKSKSKQYYAFYEKYMYEISFKGNVKFVEMCNKKMGQIRDKLPHDSREKSGETTAPSGYDVYTCFWSVKYFAKCGGFFYDSKFQSDMTTFESGMQFVITAYGANSKEVWQQMMMYAQTVNQNYCEGVYVVGATTPATSG